MTMKKTDRRVQKTRRLLQDALITLVSEKGFSSVTIQEILDRANVGRSTFYLHFDDKQDLLHSCFEDLTKLFEQYNIDLSGSGKLRGDFLDSGFTQDLFQFIGQNHRLFKAFMGKDSTEMFFHPIYGLIRSYVGQSLGVSETGQKRSALQLELLSNYLTSALLGALCWWIDKDMPCPAEEVSSYFTRVARFDIRVIFSSDLTGH